MELDLDPRLNVIAGGNGAGKTSLLEAIYVLGRARSFRTADNRVLIRTGATQATVSGEVLGPAGRATLGVGITSGGVQIQVAGRLGGMVADLAENLPVQAIHAEIGGVVQGPPEPRRRLLDWGVFHVKHDYLEDWRQFRRALLQRNALLRASGDDELLEAWEAKLAELGEAVHQHRLDFMKVLGPTFEEMGSELLGDEVGLRYQRGWGLEQELLESLRTSRDDDRGQGFTRSGPHRADLQFEIRSERSRWRASKGQQKLLGAALVLAQCRVLAEAGSETVTLLVDEPAADLDRPHLERLLTGISTTGAQLVVAAIDAETLGFGTSAAMFHVEHGSAKALL